MSPNRSSGFSLVEILVGVAISLIGMVVMFQTMQNWEGRKRTTLSGSDAQVSGSIAMFNIERDIKMAGFGFGSAAEMGCTVKGYDATRASGAGAVIPDFGMIPVLITQGASGAPDTVTVLYGNGATAAAGLPFINSTATTKIANNADGLKPGDQFIAADSGGNCALFETITNPAGVGAIVTHVTGSYTNYQGATVNARYNKAGDGMGIGVGLGGVLYNMGTTPRLDVWRVAGGRLGVANILANETASDVAEGVVNFQAQYGFDRDIVGAAGYGFIAATVNAGGDAEWLPTATDATVPATAAEWRRVLAIRAALLVRSQQYEPLLNSPNPGWAGGNFVMMNLDGSAGTTNPNDATNWRRYRYRVYETVIPLRNVGWGAS